MQSRFWNFQDDDLTTLLNHWKRNFFKDGVYYGFDADLTLSGLNLTLKHTTNGMSEVTDALAVRSNIGVILTNQGSVIQEDANVVIPIAANASGNPRIDLIVCEHQISQVVGGIIASYPVITGTPSAIPVAPAPVNNYQTIIGTLYVPDGTSNLNAGGVIWTKNLQGFLDVGKREIILSSNGAGVMINNHTLLMRDYSDLGANPISSVSGALAADYTTPNDSIAHTYKLTSCILQGFTGIGSGSITAMLYDINNPSSLVEINQFAHATYPSTNTAFGFSVNYAVIPPNTKLLAVLNSNNRTITFASNYFTIQMIK